MGYYENVNGDLELRAGSTLYADSPLGTILPFGGAAAPIGWFLCQGQAISRITYADLFAVIGTAFGSGDGSTTFNIPDLREATVKGTGLTSKSNNHLDADGLTLGEFIDDRIQSHTHTYTDAHNGTNPSYGRADYTGSATEKYNFDGFTLTTSAPTGRSGITTEVKAVGVNYIIKAKMVALPADLDSAVDAKIAAKGVYSTNEVDTGKTWIDGKKIYRKTIVADLTVPSDGEVFTTMGSIPSTFETIIGATGFCKQGTANWVPFPRTSISGENQQSLFYFVRTAAQDRGSITLVVKSTDCAGSAKFILTLEYTKTTD